MKVQAMIFTVLTSFALAACADAPTADRANGPEISASALALEIGDRVATTRYITVRTTSASDAPAAGPQQPTGATGAITGGPVTTSDGLERWQVDFDTGTDGWVVGKYIVFVSPPPPPQGTYTLTPATDTIGVGDTLRLRVRDATGTLVLGRNVTWTSSSPAATISIYGIVTGLTAGAATITATYGSWSGTSRITIGAPTPPPPPSGATLMFASDWSTALGRTDAALRDTGKPEPWDIIAANGQLNQVVSAAGLDFPTSNVLRVQGGWRGSPAGAAAENPRLEASRGHIEIPAVGQSIYYRWYIRVVVPNSYTADPLTHPIQDGTQGETSNWQQEVRSATNGTWSLTWNVNGNGQNPYPNNRWAMTTSLQKNQTYRVELQLLRTGTSTFALHARVYNSAGQQIAGDANFRNADGSATLASNRNVRFLNVNQLAGFQAGFNGLNGGTQSMYPVMLYYQGGFAITKGGWAGAYGSVAGER